MAALSTRGVCLAAAPVPRLRRPSGGGRRGALQVVAAKKNKRKEERKAQQKAENKALATKHGKGEEEGEAGDDDGAAAEAATGPSSGPAPFESTAAIMQSLTICGSFKQKTDDKLIEGTLMVQEAAEALWNAPFVCASHDASDVFNYGNKAALSLWGLSWDEFIGLPSTKSAQDEGEGSDEIQSERRELLDKAAATGVIRDYSCVRQTSKGRRFRINAATVWTITDRDGNKTGQAVRFDSFDWLDGEDGDEEMMVTDGGEIVPKPAVSAGADASSSSDDDEAPSSADVEAAVAVAAAEVRRLKEEEGLSNADKEVQAAVEELLERKNALAALEDGAD
jgi:PAS domain-containing protein